MNIRFSMKRQYLVDWARARWADSSGVVRVPPRSGISHLLQECMIKRPRNVPPTDTGNVEFHLPSRAGGDGLTRKDALYYNYISRAGRKVIEDYIYAIFWYEAHTWVHFYPQRTGGTYFDGAIEFLQRYKIETLTVDAVLKSHQRWKFATMGKHAYVWRRRKK